MITAMLAFYCNNHTYITDVCNSGNLLPKRPALQCQPGQNSPQLIYVDTMLQ